MNCLDSNVRRRKRTWIALASLLFILPPILFIVAEGPVLYSAGRGWLPLEAYNNVYIPVLRKVEPALPLDWQIRHFEYRQWWMEQANNHRHRR